MKYLRMALLLAIVGGGIALVVLLCRERPSTPHDSTLAPAYQLFGRTTKSLNSALTRIMPIDDIDEKEYGDAIALRYAGYADTSSTEYAYCNDLLSHISVHARKRFHYRLYVLDYAGPNAFAMPGGVIFVTRDLLDMLGSEAELVAVLAHEMGHIELSHCLDTVRFELMMKKMGSASMGELADITFNLMLRHSYSKTQENEADEYAYALMLNTSYNPSAAGRSFESLLEFYKRNGGHSDSRKADLVRDYFLSHPHIEHRAEKFSEKAHLWWERNKGARRYNGVTNLKKRISMYHHSECPDEWSTGLN